MQSTSLGLLKPESVDYFKNFVEAMASNADIIDSKIATLGTTVEQNSSNIASLQGAISQVQENTDRITALGKTVDENTKNATPKITVGSNNFDDYSDLNVLPVNCVCNYINNLSDVVNKPNTTSTSATVFTYNGDRSKDLNHDTNKSFTVQMLTDSNNVTYIRSCWNKTWSDWAKVSTKEYFVPNLCEFSAFNTFGIIGDSLSVGAHRESDGTTVLSRDTNSSWGQYIASRCFNQAKWFGFSGATSSSWITKTGSYTDLSGRVDRVGLSAVLDSDNKCDAYIVAFGYNDASGTVPLGSVSDIAENPDNNADTYYGNMDRIIRKINTAYPNAHIFVLTNPRLNQSMTTEYNNAIRNIVSRLSSTEKIHCIDLYDLYNDKYQQWDGLMWHYHYTKPLYFHMGELIGTALSNYMRENPLTFRFLNEQ